MAGAATGEQGRRRQWKTRVDEEDMGRRVTPARTRWRQAKAGQTMRML